MTTYRLIFVTLLFVINHQAISAEPQSIEDIDWLIGNWTFVDQSTNGNYTETGSRNCEYVLHRSHIRCTSLGKSNTGKERSYFFYFSYNKTDKRFEIVALNSHFPRTDLYAVTVSESGHRLDLVTSWFTNDGLQQHNTATIIYNGTDQYVWDIRTGELDAETGLPAVTFRDTVTRVSPRQRQLTQL